MRIINCNTPGSPRQKRPRVVRPLVERVSDQAYLTQHFLVDVIQPFTVPINPPPHVADPPSVSAEANLP